MAQREYFRFRPGVDMPLVLLSQQDLLRDVQRHLHSFYVENLIMFSATSFFLSPHLPSTPQMENGPHAPMYQLLNLFAYGTYCDYKGIAVAAQCK